MFGLVAKTPFSIGFFMSYENRPDSRDLPDQDIKILSSEICFLIKLSYRGMVVNFYFGNL